MAVLPVNLLLNVRNCDFLESFVVYYEVLGLPYINDSYLVIASLREEVLHFFLISGDSEIVS